MVDVDIVFQQQVDDLSVALSNSVVNRKLTELILRAGVHTLLQEELDQTESFLLVLDCASFKQRCLKEVDGVVADGGHVETVCVHHVYDFFAVAFRQLLEKLAHNYGRNRGWLLLGRGRLAILSSFLLKLNFLVGFGRHYILLCIIWVSCLRHGRLLHQRILVLSDRLRLWLLNEVRGLWLRLLSRLLLVGWSVVLMVNIHRRGSKFLFLI